MNLKILYILHNFPKLTKFIKILLRNVKNATSQEFVIYRKVLKRDFR